MKKMIEKVIFKKIDYDKPILFSTIKDVVQDNDIIHSGWDEGFYIENNSIDGHYFMRITREILETDEEYNKRVKQNELTAKWAKERRYESYLKLKKEFEQ